METSFFSPGRAVLEKTLDVSFIPAMGVVLLSRLLDFPVTTLILLAAGVIYTTRNVLAEETRLRDLRLNWLDIATVVVMATEIVNYFASTYRLNTLASLADVSFLFLLYWTIRVNLKHEYQLIGLILILTLFGLYLTGRVIYVFWSQYHYLTLLRFDDFSSLRERLNLLTPEGMAISEWVTLFLMFLPFPVLLLIKYSERLRLALLPAMCCLLVMLIAIAITFSRALYISAFSFFLIGSVICFYYGLFSLRQLLIFNGLLTLAFWVFIVFSPIAKPVVTTMSLLQTPSQVRSLQGRVSTWTTALEMTRSHPLLGIGAYNFPMQYVAYRPPNTVYVSRALNLLLQILVERGLLGLVAFGLLLFSFLKTSVQRLRLSKATVFERGVVALFVAATIAAVIRDLSYFSIMNNKGVAMLLCFMFACNGALPLSIRSTHKLFPAGKSVLGFFSILALMMFVFVSLKYSHVLRSEASFRSFARNFALQQNVQASSDIEKAVDEVGENAYYVSNKALLLATVLTVKFDSERTRENRFAFDEQDRARIRTAIALYDRALELNPTDDSFHHNVGWLHYFLGQSQEALVHIRKAIDISSDVALYHVSLGLIYESTDETDKALNEYTIAVRLSPGIVDSEFFQDFKSRLPQEAEKALRASTSYFEEQLAGGNDPIANASLGKLYLYSGRVDEAMKKLRDSTLQLPTLSRAWLNLGQCYELMGNESEARLAYEKVAFLDEENYSALDRLGNLVYQQHQPTEAIAYYEKALSRFQRQSSIHSERVFRVYRSKQIVPNDIVPTRLLAYCEPAFDRAAVYSRLAELERER